VVYLICLRVNRQVKEKPVNTVVVPVQIRIENLKYTSQKRYRSLQLVRFRLERLKEKVGAVNFQTGIRTRDFPNKNLT
jgi:hypothetical protein